MDIQPLPSVSPVSANPSANPHPTSGPLEGPERMLDVIGPLVLLGVVFLGVMTLFRAGFAWRFSSPDQTPVLMEYLLRAFWMGFRFDLAVICYLNVIPLLGLWGIQAWGKPLGWVLWRRAARWYLVGVYGAVSAILAGDMGFYSYFQDHYNVMIFGLWEDDTLALMQTFWKNYNLPVIFLLAGGYGWGLVWGTGKLLRPAQPVKAGGVHNSTRWQRSWGRRMAVPLVLLVTSAGGRGSFGMYPLNQMDAAISPSLFVNQVAFNGVFSLARAVGLRLENGNAETDVVAAMGYGGQVAQAYADFLGKPLASIGDDPEKSLEKTTPVNPLAEKLRPHVVLLVVESWGSWWRGFQGPDFDLDGELGPHLKSDLLFSRFLPGGNGTIVSLNTLVSNLPYLPGLPHLQESRYMYTSLETGAGLPFQRQGYDTLFVYGGTESWRDIDRYIPRQGFSEVKGQEEIARTLRPDPERFTHTWGVYDEWLWDYTFHRLRSAKKPMFIMALSTTNHPPYEVPPDYQPLPLKVPPALQSRLTGSADIVAQRFRSFQYSNRMLGRFLNRLKASPLGSHTIVAITGDHNFGGIVDFKDEEAMAWRGVPLYLYIPPALRPKRVNTNVLGNHQDILPTLYHLALSGQRYTALGANLLNLPPGHRVMDEGWMAVGPEGSVISRGSGWDLYRWQGEPGDSLLIKAPGDPRIDPLRRWLQAELAVSDDFLKRQYQAGRGAEPGPEEVR
ncbi:MAG: LTA synthase family protein [Deltaproteobacteria bacterium]|nr:LTA synthase family protein [Deltaproteobacteria bacterium]